MSDPLQYDIVMIDDDLEAIDELIRVLRENRHQVRLFNDADRAAVQQAAAADAVVFNPARFDDLGAEFIGSLRLRRNDSPLPLIAMTGATELERRLEIMRLDIDELLIKPLYAEEAAARIEQLIREVRPLTSSAESPQAFFGELKEMAAVDLIRTLQVGGKSGVVRLRRGDKAGSIRVKGGYIVDAALDEQPTAERALLHLLTWQDGHFSVDIVPLHDPDPSDERQNAFAAMVRRVEEWREHTAELPAPHGKLVPSAQIIKPLSAAERALLQRLVEPLTLLQIIEHSDQNEAATLGLITSLVLKGALIPSREPRPAEEQPRRTYEPLPVPPVRRGKSRYAHIFSLYRRPCDEERRPAAELGDEPGRADWGDDAQIISRPSLTKAELLLIRQQLSKSSV